MSESQYHAFLSHHGEDKPAVEELAERLQKEGINCWLDCWDLIPGEPWMPVVERALKECDCCCVFIGPNGMGPWQHEEIRAAIARRVKDTQFRVIPILLPGGRREQRSHLPTFLVEHTWVEFHESLDEEDAFHRLKCGILGIPVGMGPGPVDPGQCPYPGLQTFQVEEAPLFFGRQVEVEWLLNKLRTNFNTPQENRFLAIVGASGSGKSSLARAGLLAAISQEQLPDSSHWPLIVCRPGYDPLKQLALALWHHPQIKEAAGDYGELKERLATQSDRLHLTIDAALYGRPKTHRAVLLVDQFEEIFTLCDNEDHRRALIDNLLEAARVRGGRSLVVITLRADFYGRCGTFPRLAAALSDHQELVGPMQPKHLHQAIERPAQLVGCELEPGLTEMLLEGMENQAGGLPLLQHALRQLWLRRSGRRLTVAAYREIGRLEGALDRYANELFEHLSNDQREICRRIFLRLIQPGEGSEDTKRRAARSELGTDAPVDEVLNRLADARLITTSGDEPSGENFVDISHEALIRGWQRLGQWVNDNRESIRIQQRLTAAASEWQQHQRDEAYLYRGARLAEADEWSQAKAAELTPLERDFLETSTQSRVQLRRREVRRTRLMTAAAITAAFCAVVATMFYFNAHNAWNEAEDSYQAAVRANKKAKAAQVEAEVRTVRTQQHAYVMAMRSAQRAWQDAEIRQLVRVLLAQDPEIVPGHPDFRGFEWDYLWRLAHSELLTLRTSGPTVWSAHYRPDRIAFRPDGSLLASGSSDESADVVIWNPKTGQKHSVIPGPKWTVVADLAFSPNGAHLATAYRVRDGYAVGAQLVIWDARTGESVANIGSDVSFTGLAYGPNGDRIAASDALGHIKIWDARSGALVRALHDSDGVVRSVTFSPNGEMLAAGVSSFSDDDSERPLDDTRRHGLHVWNAVTGQEIAVLQGHYAAITSAAFSPDGKYLASASEAAERQPEVMLWDVATRKVKFRFVGHAKSVYRVNFSQDGNLLATASADKTARVWDVTTGQLLHTLRGHTETIGDVAFQPNTDRIASIDSDSVVKIWRVANQEYRTLWRHADPIVSFDVSADGERIVVVSVRHERKRVFNEKEQIFADEVHTKSDGYLLHGKSGGELLRFGPIDYEVASVALSQDGSRVATAGGPQFSETGEVIVWDASTGDKLLTLRGHTHPVTCVRFSPDSKMLASAASQRDGSGGEVKLWDTVTGRELHTFAKSAGVLNVEFGPRGQRIATFGWQAPSIQVWNVANNSLYRTFRDRNEATAVQFSPDGQRLAIALNTDFPSKPATEVILWEMATGKLVRLQAELSKRVTNLTYSPDGSRLATASRGMVRLWDTTIGQEILNFRLAGGIVKHLAFSPDGNQIVTAVGNELRVWDGTPWKNHTNVQ